MDVEAAVFRKTEDSRRYEEAEGHGDDEVYRTGRCPARECVHDMRIELEVFARYLLDRYCLGSMDVLSFN